MLMLHPTRRSRGFTLIEVGIAVAAVAILAIAVLSLRGFKSSAKVASTVQMVKTLQTASRAWSERYRSSASFVDIDLEELYKDDLVQNPVLTPWKDTPTFGAAPGNPEYIEIIVEVPDPRTGDDLQNAMTPMGDVTRVSPRRISLRTR